MLRLSLRRTRSSSRRGQGLRRLPIELWIDILRDAQYDDLVPSYKWLKRFALVCRAWRPYAQQLLFAHVALPLGASHCRAFIRSMASTKGAEHAAMLTASIHTLSMALDHQDVYADVLEMCPNLRELRMTLYHASFRPHILSRISRIAPSMKMLHIQAHYYSVLLQILPLFHAVEVLDIDCSIAVQDLFPDLAGRAAPVWRLRDLRYNNLHWQTDGFVKWALSGAANGSLDTVEALQVECRTFFASSVCALGLSRLRSLHVGRVTEDDDFSSLTQLEEIMITLPRQPPPAFHVIPSGVKHIGLNAIDDAERPVVLSELRAYRERTGSSLLTITYQREFQDTEGSFDDIRALYQLCEVHAIQFRLIAPPYGHCTGEGMPLSLNITVPRAMPLSLRRNSLPSVETLLQMPEKKSSAQRLVSKKSVATSGSN
ncbi:hypothetical protein OH76DRAFT_1409696 [Lentinus brumalis]|uniref:F-box domain-containing protein n=1 Tax=Lentinus brumalis TaxID=2498619 RepID=A0A371CUD6_9APHY|nr:hypothetical protein OH76DRAFT_1409696 [Polyporus brumalis]